MCRSYMPGPTPTKHRQVCADALTDPEMLLAAAPSSFVQKTTVCREFADLLVPLAAKMSEEPFRLVIMDSVAANLRVDFTGRGPYLSCFVLRDRRVPVDAKVLERSLRQT